MSTLDQVLNSRPAVADNGFLNDVKTKLANRRCQRDKYGSQVVVTNVDREFCATYDRYHARVGEMGDEETVEDRDCRRFFEYLEITAQFRLKILHLGNASLRLRRHDKEAEKMSTKERRKCALKKKQDTVALIRALDQFEGLHSRIAAVWQLFEGRDIPDKSRTNQSNWCVVTIAEHEIHQTLKHFIGRFEPALYFRLLERSMWLAELEELRLTESFDRNFRDEVHMKYTRVGA